MTHAGTDSTAQALRPLYFGSTDARLFGVFHPAHGAARGAVLMCPPLLHEQIRSYRFFSQIAQHLAAAGFACLRFDYRGTGDSDGDDADFLPSTAAIDITDAAAQLRALAGSPPLTVFAIRGSAALLGPVIHELDAAALWLWQPVLDGRAYVETLDRQAAAEYVSRQRYPRSAGTARRVASDVVGFRLAAGFREAMRASSLTLAEVPVPIVILDMSERLPAPAPALGAIALPASVARWAEEIDLLDMIRLRDAEPALASLLQATNAQRQAADGHG